MIAVLFPGQGSQRPGAGAPWVGTPEWALVEGFSRAADVDVGRLLLDANNDDLRQTIHSQLVAVTFGLVVFRRLAALGLRAHFLAGHSVGEFVALTAGGALGVGGLARLVSARGRAMHEQCERAGGRMRAFEGIGPEDAEVACAMTGDDVWVAAYNAPDQTVISGSDVAVTAAERHARQLGVCRPVPLRVGGAFHTPLMAPAREALGAALDRECLADAAVPVVTNVDARFHTEAAQWRTLLVAQLCAPVRWRQSLGELAARGVDAFVVIDPGRTLVPLVVRTCPDVAVYRVATPREADELAARLALRGVAERAEPALDRVVTEHVLRSPRDGSLVGRETVGVGTESGLLVSRGEEIARVGGTLLRAPFDGWILDDTTSGAWVAAGDPVYRFRAQSMAVPEATPA